MLSIRTCACRLYKLYRFTFSTGDEGIDDDLCTIEEVSKLSLPDGQVARALNTEPILKAKHSLFTQGTVGNLKWCASIILGKGVEFINMKIR